MEQEKSRNKKQKKKKVFSRVMRTKLVFSFGIILALLLFLLGRIIFLYKTKGVKYSNAVLSHLSYAGSRIPYERGDIVDRNGNTMATSQAIYNVIADPSVIFSSKKDLYIEPTLDALSESFGIDKEELRTKLTEGKTKQYMILKKGMEFDAVQAFKKLQADNKNIKGVWFELEYKRVYPNNALASHVIGYTNAGNVGSYGIEQYYNDYLNGSDGRTYGYYDNELNLVETVIDAKNGGTVVSTIDSFSQAVVEDEIRKFLDQYKVCNIGVLLMNPKTGEIYAMASNKNFDLNNPRDLSLIASEEELGQMSDEDKTNALNTLWRNFCISDTYEPGSTYKLVTVAGALEENKIAVTETQDYNCPGYIIVGPWQIRCSNRRGHGKITLTQGIEYSCNCALMEIGEKMGQDSFLKYQELLNFGRKTGIDLPGEAPGILLSKDQFGPAEFMTSTFGQSFNVTMVQMAAAYSSLVNGGYYYQPHIVSQVINSDGVTVYSADDMLKKMTVSKDTSEYMRYATGMVVKEGTGTSARVEGYTVGGKTGTAQKGNRADRNFVVSFIGSVPADNPELVSYVVIDQIDDPQFYNSSRPAGLMTSAVLSRVLPHLGIYPESGDIEYHVGEFSEEVNEGLSVEENDGTEPAGELDPNGPDGRTGDDKPEDTDKPEDRNKPEQN
ncbi:MAG: peptidoglycan glycosyltransferase [Lachnospiraceae bacterium]|nr:peptidoglycan glycosyltransferase [Lachnospiraceae bacterium]